MATDIAKLVTNVLEFHDFRGKTVLSVGAGGGQLVDYCRPASKVIAVDTSAPALEKLETRLAASGLSALFTLVQCDFQDFHQKADIVVFEFCLHEMPDPGAALDHAQELAGDIVVLDHLPGSPWIYYGTEEEKVAASWGALRSRPLRKFQSYEAEQFFKDHEELRQKVGVMGELAIQRVEPFAGQRNFSIPMTYAFALI
jgi:tRNA A58 N-methylase Trm61